MKKRIAMLLAICMVVTMIPSMAFAAEVDNAGSMRDKNEPAKKMLETKSKKGSNPEIGDFEAPAKGNEGLIADFNEVSSESDLSAKKGYEVAYVNGVYYDYLQDAIDAAGSGDTITLCDDVVEGDIYIYDKNISINLNDYYVASSASEDIFWIEESNVYMYDGNIMNLSDNYNDENTCVYTYASYVEFDSVGTATAGADYATGIWVGPYSDAELYNCTYLNGSALDEIFDFSVTGFNISSDAYADMDYCKSMIDDGWCTYVWGEADVNKCYFVGAMTDTFALGVDDGYLTVRSGYYYGECPLYVWGDGWTSISEGQFESYYTSDPAIACQYGGYDGGIGIASGCTSVPTTWKTKGASEIFVFKNLAAPSSMTSNLTAVNGQSAGYDDIRVTWGKVSAADGYRVTYKKGTGSYTGSKYYSPSATRARTVANLSDGYKYTFKVVSCVAVNEDILEQGTLCPCAKNITRTTYTLKKITLNSFSRSSGKVKVAWKNISGETGYQISKSTKKSGTNIVSTVASTSAKSKLISATKGKTYYYKVRAYKTVSGKKIYGPWSNVKSYKR